MRSDADLLGASAAGDADAFVTLVQRHQASLHRYLRTRTTDAAAAEDALQEAFVAAWNHAGSFRGAGSARSWLFTIARRATARRLRLRSGEPATHEPLHELGAAAGWGSDDDPEALAALVERRDLLLSALERLSATDREVVVLSDLEGFSAAEVADHMEIGVRAAKSRLHRARLRLTAIIREDLHHA